jgi:probable HAF family extracellular repeat protein
MQDLGTFGGDNGFAEHINEAGEIAGSADFPGNQIHHAALWRNGAITDLGTVAGDPCSRAYGINAMGQIVGGSSSCTAFLHAFLWENGGSAIDLNSLVAPGAGLTLTQANFINDRGDIAAVGVLPNGDQRAVLLIPCDEEHSDEEGCEDGSRAVEGGAVANLKPALHDEAQRLFPERRKFRRLGARLLTPEE